MKKIILIGLSILSLILAACTNISGLEDRVTGLEDRVSALEQLCKELNANVTTIQAFVKAREQSLTITSVEKLNDGFAITFSSGERYVLKNGEKGNKGEPGPQGETGPIGATPEIGLKPDGDNIVWTVNGEIILVNGQPVNALAVTPKLDIQGEKWVISYDGGKTWTEVAPAYDTSSRLVITEDDDFVYFTFGSDAPYALPKKSGFSFLMEKVTGISIAPGQTIKVAYTLKEADESVRFEVRCTGGFTAQVNEPESVVVITAPDPISDGYVIVTAIKNSTGDIKAQYVTFTSGILNLVSTAHNAPAEGGTIDIVYQTNLGACTVNLPAGCDWITPVPKSKATEQLTAQVTVSANTKGPRQAELTLIPEGGTPELKVLITQDAAAGYNPNNFTYVLWGVEGQFTGNNLGLTPLTDYPNQFRVDSEFGQVTMIPLQSDIPAGATVTYNNTGVGGSSNWKLTNNSNWNDGVSGFKKNDENGATPGQFTLKYTTTPKNCRVHALVITVTVSGLGGEADVPVTRYIPIFIDQSGYRTIGNDDFLLSCTPFVLRVNPKKGGTLAGPSITAKTSGNPSQMRLDFRRNFFFYNFYGPATHSTADGRALSATNAGNTILANVWSNYFTPLGKPINYGSCAPLSWFNDNNYEIKEQLGLTGLYIDNADGLKLVVNPDKFKDADGNYAEGIFTGTVAANSEGNNPLSTGMEQAEVFPFVVWFDASL